MFVNARTSMEDFFLILPSNANPQDHPENNPSQFRVSLQDPIQLDGMWEVALEELTYIQTFQTLTNASVEILHDEQMAPATRLIIKPIQTLKLLRTDDHPYINCHYDSVTDKIIITAINANNPLDFYCKRHLAEDLGFSKPSYVNPLVKPTDVSPHDYRYLATSANAMLKEFKSKHPFSPAPILEEKEIIGVTQGQGDKLPAYFDIPSGYYPKASVLLPFLNVKSSYYVDFQFSTFQNRFTIRVKQPQTKVYLKGGLAAILGFEKPAIHYNDGYGDPITAKHAPSMFAGSHSFFIYCSICADMNVANVKVPLLRTVAINTQANFGDVINLAFRVPIYVPVNTNYINSIMIDVRNDMGRPIHFTEGKTQLVLHFRPVSMT